jgi:hypothetical protein
MNLFDERPDVWEKIAEVLEQWCITFKLIGSHNETPRYSQIIPFADSIRRELTFEERMADKRICLNGTVSNVCYIITDFTEEQTEWMIQQLRFNSNEAYSSYKEKRTEYLKTNHPTINPY